MYAQKNRTFAYVYKNKNDYTLQLIDNSEINFEAKNKNDAILFARKYYMDNYKFIDAEIEFVQIHLMSAKKHNHKQLMGYSHENLILK